ncbi:Cysteine--tRNA ligase [Methanosalsum zhilinae DSM 4017]|uniref:Cysteine--tRNA ligase n=1 Tax=Methanosalsum zhilinae (strain DSM 4017 / NBRC 107636 / OCM 62 / WeN5) TaxID=679901 RepID=F7XKT0_METZD|nr:class I tRNA ligase family protein [Methanosalsum zhilinae]AEH61793.1 Cysteine--tRNA ligase [Methanosalsum zhilinae DSM 4017]
MHISGDQTITLKIYNSLTGRKDNFQPLNGNTVEMFTCGPSIYRIPHLGNYRTLLLADVLAEYLKYRGFSTIHALNFTDIEDKAIKEAESNNMAMLELVDYVADRTLNEMETIGVKPTYNPRSSKSIDAAVEIIEGLLNKGYAYWYKGNVYFRLERFAEYGKLAGIKKSEIPEQKKRFHRDTYPGNPRNIGDFILWHGYRKNDNVYWDTPIGRGRPSWNVQDSAMILKTMGSSIDIMCGGEDSLARHHDYNIAVMESYTDKKMARYWIHCSHLLAGGKKMSKSRDNIILLEDLLKNGYTPEEIRFFLIYGHYRQKLNFTYKNIDKSSEKLKSAHEMIRKIQAITENKGRQVHRTQKEDEIETAFIQMMDDDLNVGEGFDTIFRKLSQIRKSGYNISVREAGELIDSVQKIDQVLKIGLLDIRQ